MRKTISSSHPPVQSVQKALQILKCFNVEKPDLSLTEISNQLNLHISTVHRLIYTLESENFVRKINDNRFALGWTLFDLGMTVLELGGVKELILETLTKIVNKTGETAHLAILDHSEVLYVEKIESTYQLRMPSFVGKHVSPHCTALGKILLAGLDDKEMFPLIYSSELEKFTPNTIIDADLLRLELLQVRKQGFALDKEELEIGLMCIAAPIINHNNKVCGAISISGPAFRIEKNVEDYRNSIVDEVNLLSNKLGPRANFLLENYPRQ